MVVSPMNTADATIQLATHHRCDLGRSNHRASAVGSVLDRFENEVDLIEC
jgi:hypothetical protein